MSRLHKLLLNHFHTLSTCINKNYNATITDCNCNFSESDSDSYNDLLVDNDICMNSQKEQVPQLIHLLRSSNWTLALQRLATHPHEAKFLGANNETTLHVAFSSSGVDADAANNDDDTSYDNFSEECDFDDENNHQGEYLNIHVPLAIVQKIIEINGVQILDERMDGSTSVMDLILSSWCDIIRIITAGVGKNHSYCNTNNHGDFAVLLYDKDLDLLPSLYEYQLRKQVIQYITMSASSPSSLSRKQQLLPLCHDNNNETNTICSDSTMEYLWNWIDLSNLFLTHYHDLDSLMKCLEFENSENDNCAIDIRGHKRQRTSLEQGDEQSSFIITRHSYNQSCIKVARYVQFLFSVMDMLLLSDCDDDTATNNSSCRLPTVKNSKLSATTMSIYRQQQLQLSKSTNSKRPKHTCFLHVLLQLYNNTKSSYVPILIIKLAIKLFGSRACNMFDNEGRTPLIIAITSNERQRRGITNRNNYGTLREVCGDYSCENTCGDDDIDYHSIDSIQDEMIMKTRYQQHLSQSSIDKLLLIKTLLDQSPSSASIPHAKTKQFPLHLALVDGESSSPIRKRLSWYDGIALLVHDSPHVLCEKDINTGLYAFALAAISSSHKTIQRCNPLSTAKDSHVTSYADSNEDDNSCLDTVYQLLLSNPNVLSTIFQ